MVKRGLLYLRRKYKRSLLLLILLFIISFSLAVGLSVWSSISAVTKEVQQTLGTSFIFKAKRDPALAKSMKMYNGASGMVYDGPEIDQTLVDKVMGIDELSGYNAENYESVYADDMELIEGGWKISFDEYESIPDWDWDLNPPTRDCYLLRQRVTNLYGNTDTERYDKFRTGAFTLVEGRHIAPGDSRKALISDEVAELNGLKRGDTIDLSFRPGIIGDDDRGHTFDTVYDGATLEIVGIYHVNGYQPINAYVHEPDITYNWIFTDNETVSYFTNQTFAYAYPG